MVLSISHITWQMRPFIKKWKSTKYTTFIWTMFIQCLETDILLTWLPFHANQDSNSKAPDVIVTRPSKASWGKWNKLRAVSLFFQIQWGECTRAPAAKLRDARNEGGSPRLSFFVPLPSRSFNHARDHLRVPRVLLDGPRKKRDCS